MRTPTRPWLLRVGLLAAALAAGCGEQQHYEVSLDGSARRVDADGKPLPVAASALAGARSLTGVIELQSGLDVDTSDFDCVFVMARSNPQGAGSDFVRKLAVTGFPLRFELTDADAMHSGGAPSAAYQIVARLDRDGDASAQFGDVQGVAAEPARPGGPPVRLVLNQVLTGDGAPPRAATEPGTSGGAVGPKFPPGEGPRFRGTITLAPGFADLDGRYTLYVIVRSKAAQGAPILVQRVERARFPVEYDLGAEHSPTQSDDSYQILAGELKVTARLSVGGDPMPSAGDVECEPVIMKGDDPPAALTLKASRAP
jgi:hypothetical protein